MLVEEKSKARDILNGGSFKVIGHAHRDSRPALYSQKCFQDVAAKDFISTYSSMASLVASMITIDYELPFPQWLHPEKLASSTLNSLPLLLSNPWRSVYLAKHPLMRALQ